MSTILLVGRNQWVIDGAKDKLEGPNLTVLGATNSDELADVLEGDDIDHVFIGPGLDIEERLDLVRQVFDHCDTTSVHFKSFSGGPEAALEFVRGVLQGLATAPSRKK